MHRIKLHVYLTLFVCSSSISWAEDVQQPATREAMHGIFGAISTVLPFTMSESEFRKTQNHKTISDSLLVLKNNATNLSQHLNGKNPDFSYAGQSLARDSEEASRRFEMGHTNEARYILSHITDDCITCHSKLPQKSQYDATAFFKNAALDTLNSFERATLLMATRQFDESQKAFETAFADPAIPPSEMVLTNSIKDYLILSLRVKNSPARALETLEKLKKRSDVPEFLQADLKSWCATLKHVAATKTQPEGLPAAIAIIKGTQSKMEFPMDRTGFVDYVVASGTLHRYINNAKNHGADVAKAYYYLGITESLIGRSFWLSETGHFFETSIRMAPQSPTAKKAYRLLEEQALLEYSGSTGTDIPDDVEKNLRDLRQLMRL